MKKSILILHGWGLSKKPYEKLTQLLTEKNFTVYSIDLPGFGSEPLMSHSMDLNDYVAFVHAFIKKNKLSPVIVIGHSFGGRVALKYAWKYPQNVSKVILSGVPVIRHMSTFKKIAYLFSKSGGMILRIFPAQIQNVFKKLLYYSIGEWDYYKSNGLREVFKNIINEDVLQYVKESKVPVILVWGENDTVTPSSDVPTIKKQAKNVEYEIVPNTNHKLPYLYPEKFVKALERHL